MFEKPGRKTLEKCDSEKCDWKKTKQYSPKWWFKMLIYHSKSRLKKMSRRIMFKRIFQNTGVSLNGGSPNLHPKMIIFSRKTHGCWVSVGISILGNPHINFHPHPFWPDPTPTTVVMTEAASGPSVTPMLKLKAMEPKILGPEIWATKKTRPYFPWNPGWFIGILILASKNPHILASKNPLYNLNNQGPFFSLLICILPTWRINDGNLNHSLVDGINHPKNHGYWDVLPVLSKWISSPLYN